MRDLNFEGLANFHSNGMFQVTEHFQFGGTKKRNLTTNREHRNIWLRSRIRHRLFVFTSAGIKTIFARSQYQSLHK
jgi:hypothetical protein